MTITDSLLLLNSTKTAIADAIEARGVAVGGIPFAGYADKIADIPIGPNLPVSGWTRPAYWPPERADKDTVEGAQILVLVPPNGSQFTLTIERGDIDWGDGTNLTVAPGTTTPKTHSYD